MPVPHTPILQSPEFRSQVGLLHAHWLTEDARGTSQKDWPDAAVPRWIAANRHAADAGPMDGSEGAVGGAGFNGGWKAFAGSSQTVQPVLLELDKFCTPTCGGSSGR